MSITLVSKPQPQPGFRRSKGSSSQLRYNSRIRGSDLETPTPSTQSLSHITTRIIRLAFRSRSSRPTEESLERQGIAVLERLLSLGRYWKYALNPGNDAILRLRIFGIPVDFAIVVADPRGSTFEGEERGLEAKFVSDKGS